jgi:hypothetical protein
MHDVHEQQCNTTQHSTAQRSTTQDNTASKCIPAEGVVLELVLPAASLDDKGILDCAPTPLSSLMAGAVLCGTTPSLSSSTLSSLSSSTSSLSSSMAMPSVSMGECVVCRAEVCADAGRRRPTGISLAVFIPAKPSDALCNSCQHASNGNQSNSTCHRTQSHVRSRKSSYEMASAIEATALCGDDRFVPRMLW